MLLLALFAFVAGIFSALSPCVLPVLPLALSAGVTGGRRRPLGVVCGLALSFTFATVVLVYAIEALGLPDALLRNLAIAVLAGFGATLLVPRAAARVEAWLSRLAPGVRRPAAGGGFWSGLGLGISLGVVHAPCAGPILAGVITVSASQSFTVARLAVALAFGIGSALALYALLRGGRRLTRRLSPHAQRLQAVAGVTMILVAGLMLGGYDTRFQAAIASDLPAVLVTPTRAIEDAPSTCERLAALRDRPVRCERPALDAGDLLMAGAAPELAGTQEWFNTHGGRPLSMRELRGDVVLIDFWTYTCINCLRTLPQLKEWDARYRDSGLRIVGVHTPEFPFERDAANVRGAIADHGLRYPVVQDNERTVWDAFANAYWPSKYLIDARGEIRHLHFGEGGYDETEEAIRALLRDAGRRLPPRAGRPPTESALAEATPETYLGARRADAFARGGKLPEGVRSFSPPGEPAEDSFDLGGKWLIGPDSSTAVAGSRIELSFDARRVFLVLSPPAASGGGSVEIRLDGRRLPAEHAGPDVRQSRVSVRSQRLHRLVELPAAGRHRLSLELDPGVSAYAFTFG